MNDKPNVPGEDRPELSKAPAAWERRQGPPEQGSSLAQSMQGANPTEYTGGGEGEAGYLAAEDQSLQSRIVGGGLDSGSEAGAQQSKLCPACGSVTTFVQGVCTNCKHKLGTAAVPSPAMDRPSYGMPAEGGSTVIRNVVVSLVLVAVLVAIGYFGVKFLGQRDDAQSPQLAGTPDSHPGGLSAVTIDDIFHTDIVAALEAGNQAWQDAGKDCHVYRYGVYEHTEPAVSQRVIITGYAGGEDVRTSIVDEGKMVFDEAFKPFLDMLSANSGVDPSIILRFTDGEETPATSDKYLRYGYYYGKEHWNDIGVIVDALEGVRQLDGEYPHSLSEKIVSPKIRTYGNFNFLANGFGFIPEFKSNAQGEIIMGSGSGLAGLLPEECSGYYLLVFAPQPSIGIDFFDKTAAFHYREFISPFPYLPKKAITNVPMEPDGEPDGIACVVYSGELMRVN